jgi:hypothetical protein
MPADPNWARWVFASIVTHLKAVATEDHHPFLIEGVDERTDTFLKSRLRAEARVTGPFTSPQQGGDYRLTVDANVLLTCDGDAQPYEIVRVAGLYQEALTTPIPVWNYGTRNGDYVPSDPSTKVLLGCLTTKPGRQESVGVFHFGQIEKTDRVRQSLVDATLEMFLSAT